MYLQIFLNEQDCVSLEQNQTNKQNPQNTNTNTKKYPISFVLTRISILGFIDLVGGPT